jgi:hypothetical protein
LGRLARYFPATRGSELPFSSIAAKLPQMHGVRIFFFLLGHLPFRT